jgi:hypothetical protein
MLLIVKVYFLVCAVTLAFRQGCQPDQATHDSVAIV